MCSTSQFSAAEKCEHIAGLLPPPGESNSKTLLPLDTTPGSEHHGMSCRRANIRTPRAFNGYLGSLCMGYLNLSCRESKCYHQSCRPKSKSSLCLKYHFPYWFLPYAISIFFQLTERSGPELVPRVPKVRPASSDVFYFACTGNIDGMQALFKSGLA